MKPNKLTAGANVMWESSRMMLPEHRERSVFLYGQEDKLKRPELTEEEQQELFGRLKASLSNTIEVTIKVYTEYGYEKYSGVVGGLDPRHKLVKLEWRADWKLIEFRDIVGVDLCVEGY
ncbi:YolD-like family protein [Paenibacillus sp. 32352]|uniref:YolD-like family protein n=1 Tax=Paenibacillus sp. 32352 TaxID=1969111 RepID=UPI0009AD0893|nr:YolD-like family protein [Paenibacillus sp. 32352]